MTPLNIQEEAEQRWRSRCPCCRRPMVEYKDPGIPGRRNPSTAKSAGHNVPLSQGGPATMFVYICAGCNVEQDSNTFAAWAYLLERKGDPRAANVREVAELFEKWKNRPMRFPTYSKARDRIRRSYERIDR